jgi:hypothetical protein
VLGSNKVLQVALGKTPADELRTNLHQLSERVGGIKTRPAEWEAHARPPARTGTHCITLPAC